MENQEILTKILAKLETLEAGQQSLEVGQESLKSEIAGVRSELLTVIESKVLPEIKLIAEQHGEIISRLKKSDEIDDVRDRVSNLERSVEKHTEQIALLQKAQ